MLVSVDTVPCLCVYNEKSLSKGLSTFKLTLR